MSVSSNTAVSSSDRLAVGGGPIDAARMAVCFAALLEAAGHPNALLQLEVASVDVTIRATLQDGTKIYLFFGIKNIRFGSNEGRCG
jgi:hypothetical protein